MKQSQLAKKRHKKALKRKNKKYDQHKTFRQLVANAHQKQLGNSKNILIDDGVRAHSPNIVETETIQL